METNITLYPKKSTKVLWIIISTIFIVIGIWMIIDKKLFGWGAVIFSGLMFLIFILELLPNSSYLTISKEGIKICNLFRTIFIKWNEIEKFTIFYYNHRWVTQRKVVGIKYYRSPIGIKGILQGTDIVLPDTYGKSAEELIELLDTSKNKFSN